MLVHRKRHIAREGRERQQRGGKHQRTQGRGRRRPPRTRDSAPAAGGKSGGRAADPPGRPPTRPQHHRHHRGGGLNERRHWAVTAASEGRNRHALKGLQGNHNRRTGNEIARIRVPRTTGSLSRRCWPQYVQQPIISIAAAAEGQERPEDIDRQMARGHIRAGNPQAAA